MIVLILLCGGGCALIPRKAETPLETVKFDWEEGVQQNRLIVYLPGRYDVPRDFEKRGLLKDLKKANVAADVIAVDAHLGYYLNQSLADRMQNEILSPARKSGFQEIWVLGNSMGGLGALFMEKAYPGSWDKMVLLAPFLGNDKGLFEEIEKSGGLLEWQPSDPQPTDDFNKQLWFWLKDYPNQLDQRPELIIGYGKNDKLARSIELLTPHLPPEKVIAVEGGHKWTVWEPLWKRILNGA